MYKCTLCSFKTKSKDEMVTHIKNNHRNTFKATESASDDYLTRLAESAFSSYAITVSDYSSSSYSSSYSGGGGSFDGGGSSSSYSSCDSGSSDSGSCGGGCD